MAKPLKSLTSLRGLVVPMAWDSSGGITGLGISFINEEEYPLDVKSEFMEDLKRLTQQSIVASGQVIEDKSGRRKFRLTHYRL